MFQVEELLDSLQAVADYYHVSLVPTQIELYLNALSDIDPYVLALAIDEHIKTSKYFPKASELLNHAAKAKSFLNHLHHLQGRAVALEDALTYQGILNPDAWLTLANDFEAANRPLSAANIKNRMQIRLDYLISNKI